MQNNSNSNKFFKIKVWFGNPENKIWLIPFYTIIFTIFLLFLTLYIDMNIKIPFSFEINKNTLDSLLSILSSSMLAVATFSIGIMVSAFSSVSSNITPRATLVVMNDKTAQNAISSFLAAFLYSVLAQVALGQGIYSESGVFILFILSIIVLIYLVFILIKWIGTLSKLGRLNDTVKKIEILANKQLELFWMNPSHNIKITPLTQHKYHILSSSVGYLCNINFDSLNKYAKKHNIKIDIMFTEGDFVAYKEVLCYVCSYIKDEEKNEIENCFIIEDSRNTDMSPDYNLTILSEIGQRALSPTVNDPGTAIYILTIIARILNRNKKTSQQEIKYENISVLPYDKNKFIYPIFSPITRDASANVDVLIHLQKILFSLSNNEDKELANFAKEYAMTSFKNTKKTLKIEGESQLLLKTHQSLFL